MSDETIFVKIVLKSAKFLWIEYHRSSIMALGSLSHVFPDEALDFLLVVDGLSVVL